MGFRMAVLVAGLVSLILFNTAHATDDTQGIPSTFHVKTDRVDYQALDYTNLERGQREYIKLSNNRLDLKYGKSRYAGFKLPYSGKPYTLEIRSYIMPDGEDFNYYYPVVEVLDHSFKPLYSIQNKPYIQVTEHGEKKYTAHNVQVDEKVGYIVLVAIGKAFALQ